MPEFTPEQKAEMSEAYTRVYGNGEGSASDVRGIPVYKLETGKPATAEELNRVLIPGVDEDFDLQAGSRGMSPSEVAARYSGTKHDADKPDAGTVLAGFWPLVRQRGIDKGELPGPVIVPMEVLDRLFDTTVSISKRLTDACKLLPLSSLEQTLRPGTYGARKKYGPDCWLTVTDGVNRYYQAAGRHALKAILGEYKDAEGLVHGECVIWCIWAGATHVLRNEQERARE